VRNAVLCRSCCDIIESRHRHDFRTCKCGAISVDGGQSYKKRCWKPGSRWVELVENESGALVKGEEISR